MPKSIIKRVHRHARSEKMQKGLKFSNRNNLPHECSNNEYNKVPEALVEKEPAPYPEILEELSGMKTRVSPLQSPLRSTMQNRLH